MCSEAPSRPARGRVEQVGAADDVCDALPGVVQHHRQLVGVEAIAALDDEIADLAAEMLADFALHAVDEAIFQLRHAQADRRILAGVPCYGKPAPMVGHRGGAGMHQAMARCTVLQPRRHGAARRSAGLSGVVRVVR